MNWAADTGRFKVLTGLGRGPETAKRIKHVLKQLKVKKKNHNNITYKARTTSTIEKEPTRNIQQTYPLVAWRIWW
jgi:hypothetical protein